MKPEQEESVKEFISGRDVLGILPTSFGKSICYGCLPLVLDELLGTENKLIVVVVTPLKAIMHDQVSLNLNRMLEFLRYNSNSSLNVFTSH